MAIPAAPLPAAAVKRKSRLRLALGTGTAATVLAGAVLLGVFLYSRFHEVDEKLNDLGGGVPEARAQALLWLAQVEPQDSRRAEVTATLEPLVFDGDIQGNLDPDLLLRAYLHWANQDNVPSMIRMVETNTLPCWNSKKTGQVMSALGKLQDNRAADVLAQKLPDPQLHEQAVDALRLLGPGGENAVMDFLFDGDPDTKARAAELLVGYGARPNTVLAEARRRLLSNDPKTRSGAAAWFAENPPEGEFEKAEMARPLAGLLGDLSPQVHGLALRALKLWVNRDCLPQVVAFAERQEKAVGSDTAANNSLLIDVLAQLPDQTAATAIALQLKDPGQRTKAVQALLKLGPVATEPVLKYLDYPDANVRKEARALCRMFKVPAERQLEQTVADVASAHKPRSRAALQQLAQLRLDEASRVKVSQALNAPLLDPDTGIRREALDALRVWATPENTAALLMVFGNLSCGRDEDSARTLERVSQTLISIGPEVEGAVTPLLKSPEVALRGAACRILAEVGTDKSVPPLQAAGQAYQGIDGAYYNYTQMVIAKIEARK
jgi:hypothetical protein